MSEGSLRSALTVAAQQLEVLGLNRGTSGNVSVRCDDEFLVTPSGVPPEQLSGPSMVRVSFGGVAETGKRPSSEWRIHRDVLHSRTEIQAVVHVHSTFATTLSTLRREIPPFHYMVAVAGGETIRCTDYALFGSEALSHLALAGLVDRKACLLGNHGMLTLGGSLDEAIAIAVEVEALCEQYWRAIQVAEPYRLSHDEMLAVIEQFKGYGRFASDLSTARSSGVTRNAMSASEIDTFKWEDGQLLMLDQRALPGKIVYLAYRDAVGVAQGIRDMVVRGAPAIGCVAAYGVALEATCWTDHDRIAFDAALDRAEDVLAASRPTAVNLSWALAAMRRVRDRVRTSTSGSIAGELLKAAHAITAEDIRANRAMGALGAELLFDGARVLTHCNAGALAAAGHGTALGVIRSAIEKGLKISVIADETRPYLQGARLTAWELSRDQIPVTLITDNMSGHLMSQGQIDAVVVGCDRVAANGDVANKIGTYMVAVLARRHGIPFYVACPIATIDRALAHGGLIPIEERAASEVTGFGGLQWAPDGISVRNPSFDVTPAELVTALITEKGLIKNPDRQSIARLFADELDASRSL